MGEETTPVITACPEAGKWTRVKKYKQIKWVAVHTQATVGGSLPST